MNIITKKNLIIAAKTAIVGIAVTGLGVAVKTVLSKKTGLPAGYEEGIVDEDQEVSTEE